MSKTLCSLRSISGLRSFKSPRTSRTFFTLPGESQSLTASRILPYKASSIYKLIADVDSYSDFVPYCTESRVTKWSAADKTGQRWPSEAELKVGWGGMDEKFTSRLFCIAGQVVEALSGEAETQLPKSELGHYGKSVNGPVLSNSVFRSLSTTWRVTPISFKPSSGPSQIEEGQEPSQDRTEISLAIDFTFSNPIYAALSRAVAPKVAGIMIEAFEIRAKRLLDGNGAGQASLKDTFRASGRMGA